jgi:hypothetical protein
MATNPYFTLTYDNTGPANPTININSSATYATQQLVTATIGTDDSDKTNYQMKIWGDIDVTWGISNGILKSGTTNNPSVEADAVMIAFSASKQIQLSTGDATKTLNVRLYDDVLNQSGQATDTIILNTTLPTLSLSTPDRTKISKQATKNQCNFNFQSDQLFTDYKVLVVSATNAVNTAGTAIATTYGSVATSGTGGNYPANTPINVTITGGDLEVASPGDGDKIIKVFVKNQAGQWSS